MPSSKTVIIGKGDIAVNCLEYLVSINEKPVLIICDKDDDGRDGWAKSLLGAALRLGYQEGKNVVVEARPNRPEFIEFLRSFEPDVIFSLQPRTIFRQDFIDSAGSAVINLHFAPLPKLRGVAPCSWAISDGLDEMGATLHLISKQGVDTDPIIFQALFPIQADDTSWTLFQGAIAHGTQLFKQHFQDMVAGHYSALPQNEADATYHPMGEFRFDLRTPDLTSDAVEVDRFLRSRIFPPMQLPSLSYESNNLIVHSSHVVETTSISQQPKITPANGYGEFIVHCSRGSLRVTTRPSLS